MIKNTLKIFSIIVSLFAVWAIFIVIEQFFIKQIITLDKFLMLFSFCFFILIFEFNNLIRKGSGFESYITSRGINKDFLIMNIGGFLFSLISFYLFFSKSYEISPSDRNVFLLGGILFGSMFVFSMWHKFKGIKSYNKLSDESEAEVKKTIKKIDKLAPLFTLFFLLVLLMFFIYRF